MGVELEGSFLPAFAGVLLMCLDDVWDLVCFCCSSQFVHKQEMG